MLNMKKIESESTKRDVLNGAIFGIITEALGHYKPEEFLNKYGEQALAREEALYDELSPMYDDESVTDEELEAKIREYKQAEEITYATNRLLDAIKALCKECDDFIDIMMIPTEEWGR